VAEIDTGAQRCTGGELSTALAIIERVRHRLRFAVSPSYRQLRRRIEEISQPIA
jgi:hypothetical protein